MRHCNVFRIELELIAVALDGQVVLAEKSRIFYLLNGSDLGGIGGQEASLASG